MCFWPRCLLLNDVAGCGWKGSTPSEGTAYEAISAQLTDNEAPSPVFNEHEMKMQESRKARNWSLPMARILETEKRILQFGKETKGVA